MVNKSELACIELFKKILRTENAETQKRFDFIRGDKGTMLPLDAWFPEYNFVLEYMGKQHFIGVKHFDRRPGRNKQRKRYDSLKREMLQKHKIGLIYFRHDEEINEENVKKKLREHNIMVA